MQRAKEEKAIVLDFLRHGYAEDFQSRRSPVIQGIGKDHFILIELVPRPDVTVTAHEEVYIGDGERDKIKFIKGTIPHDKLTQTAKSELPHVLEKLVAEKANMFVTFFNIAAPISLRAHSLELLPGVGKKHALQILEERKKKPFDDIEDFKKRVTSISNPLKVIINRILEELEGKDRHRLFVGA